MFSYKIVCKEKKILGLGVTFQNGVYYGYTFADGVAEKDKKAFLQELMEI